MIASDSASSNSTTVSKTATTATLSAPHNVSPLATDPYVVAALMWAGAADLSGASFGMQFGKSGSYKDMTLLGSKSIATTRVLKAFILDDPDDGPQNLVANIASMPTEANGRLLWIAAASFSGFDAVDLSTLVTAGGTNTTANSVTVANAAAKEAFASIFIHGVLGTSMRVYNQTLRANSYRLSDGHMFICTAPGAASTTSTGTMTASTSNWAAIGVSASPAPVVGNASIELQPPDLTALGGISRVQPPSPNRTWVLKREK
jgi:hypothetical protein